MEAREEFEQQQQQERIRVLSSFFFLASRIRTGASYLFSISRARSDGATKTTSRQVESISRLLVAVVAVPGNCMDMCALAMAGVAVQK